MSSVRAKVDIGVALASRQIIIGVGAASTPLSPDEATELANLLTGAVDQLDGREVGQCGWRSGSADDGYCRCVKPSGHDGVHLCLHGLDHNATGREVSDALTYTLDEAAQEYESPK